MVSFVVLPPLHLAHDAIKGEQNAKTNTPAPTISFPDAFNQRVGESPRQAEINLRSY